MGQPNWDELAELALARVRASGAEYGDIRIVESRTETVRGEDRRLAEVRDSRDGGFGVRVLYHGAWGFAASAIRSLEEVPRVAELAVEIAKGSATLAQDRVRLAEEPVHRDSIMTARTVDPFSVPLEQRTAMLLEAMESLHRHSAIVRSRAQLWARQDVKLFVSTEGSRLHFDLLAVQGELEATAVHDSRFASRVYNTPHLRTGYELINQANLVAEAHRVAAEAVEKVKNYILDIVFATRDPEAFKLPIKHLIAYGGSPRATIFLAEAARAHAFLRGRGYATPEDVKAVGFDVLRHRVIVTYEAEAEEKTSADVVKAVLDHVAVP